MSTPRDIRKARREKPKWDALLGEEAFFRMLANATGPEAHLESFQKGFNATWAREEAKAKEAKND
jgi:hypothetical protein